MEGVRDCVGFGVNGTTLKGAARYKAAGILQMSTARVSLTRLISLAMRGDGKYTDSSIRSASKYRSVGARHGRQDDILQRASLH